MGIARALRVAAAVLLLGVFFTPAGADDVTGLELGLGWGARSDDFDWSIAGTPQGTDPNILSELTWDDLEIYQVQLRGMLAVGREDFPWFDTVLKGMVGYGWIVDGETQDSDYLGDNRTQEFSRSNNATDGDEVIDASVAIGPRFELAGRVVTLTPLGGYSWHRIDLRMTDGLQTLSDQALADAVLGPGQISLPPLGPFPGLDSTYEATWQGPWAGVDLELRPFSALTLGGSFAYHWLDYDAEANWNLRPDLAHPKSFSHDADGDGITLRAAASLDLGRRWSVTVNYDYLDWETDPGTARVYLTTGEVPGTRLNGVNWRSQAVMAGVNFRFY